MERRGEALDEGLGRLRAAVRTAAAGEDASFADRIYRALIGEASLEDDIALLAIESLALGHEIEMTLDADTSVLAGARRTVGRWLASADAGEEELFDIALATSEAAANAIEHAHGARRATFSVRCERDGPNVCVTVADSGRWRETTTFARPGPCDHARARRHSRRAAHESRHDRHAAQAAHGEATDVSALDIERIKDIPVARPREDIDAATAG